MANQTRKARDDRKRALRVAAMHALWLIVGVVVGGFVLLAALTWRRWCLRCCGKD